jgi:hypothetical protein
MSAEIHLSMAGAKKHVDTQSANIVVKAEKCECATICFLPCGQGTDSSFYRPRGGGLQSCCTVLDYVWRYGV